MQLRKLFVRNFRSYSESLFEFDPHLNFIHGDNAQGKTTILEAIYLLMVGRSFRTIQSNDLIRCGEKHFFIECHFTKYNVDQKLCFAIDSKERKILYNSTSCSNLNSLIGLINGVLITPNDELIKGSPQIRRSFLDLHIAQTDPLYLHHLTRYQRALKHRNALLKQKQTATIESWENELASAGAYITEQRIVATDLLAKRANSIYQELSSTLHQLVVSYRNKIGSHTNFKDYFLAQFKSNKTRELALGITMSGPHRDEMGISLNEQDARLFASEGEQRTCITALRLASWHTLKERVEVPPLLLIDDVGVSLDNQRIHFLFEYLTNLGQTFITSTQRFVAPANVSCHYLHIAQNRQQNSLQGATYV